MAMSVGRPVNIMKDNGAAAIFYIMHVLTRDDPEARHALTSRERLGNGMRHTLAGKIFFTVVALFAASFLLYQVMTVSSKKISTEYVLHYSYYDAITADGYFVRNEQVLTTDADGVLSYTVGDGEHVSASGTVAEVYSNEADASAQARMKELQEQIDALNDLQSGSGKYSTDPDLLGVQINEKLTRLLSIVDKGRLDGLDSTAASLLNLMNKRQIATGMAADFSATIAQLESELSGLQSSAGKAASKISVPSSGYFVSTVDGLEQALTIPQLETLTPEQLEEVRNIQPQEVEGAVGKLVYDYEWYIACTMTEEQASLLTKGQTIDIVLQIGTQSLQPVTVSAINQGSGAGRCVVILRCDYTSSELFSARQESIQIRLKEYTGLRVASSAVRVVDGVRGVYVMSGIAAKFKPINILYSNASFTICETDTASSALKLYDEVIVEGKDLYDGKLVK